MGKTYRGPTRKEFGSKKARNHKSRSKWTAKNGTRLRSLNADVAEFQAHEASLGVSLHRPPDHPNRGNELAETIRQLKASPPKPVVTVSQQTPRKIRQFDILGAMDTVTLEARKDHAAKQVAHLTKVMGLLRREFRYDDPAACAALKRYEKQRVLWSKETGTIGPILSARKSSS